MKNNIRKITAILASSLCMLPLWGTTVSPEEALTIAASFRKGNSGALMAPHSSPCIAYTALGTEGNPLFYVVNRGNGKGFLLVGGDTALPAVLGYVECGDFSYADMPAPMRTWLAGYSDQIDFALSPSARESAESQWPSTPLPDVEPLCQAAWGQRAPFNSLTPTINGDNTPVGCLATALAQVAYRYRWPENGCGSRDNFSFDVSYRWNDMLPQYAEQEYSEEQASAAATISYHLAQSVATTYRKSESTAYHYEGAYALTEFFGYDAGSMRYLMRGFFSDNAWKQLMYDEVAAGRPVVYAGFTDTSGHAFICDGYQEGFFHINWGWEGKYNGYFLLDALNPDGTGSGESGPAGGYNYSHEAIIGIQPDQGGTYPGITFGATCNLAVETSGNGHTLYFRSMNPGSDARGRIMNIGYRAASAEFGVRFRCVSSAAQEDLFFPEETSPSSAAAIYQTGYGPETVTLSRRDIPDGNYEVSVVCKAPEDTRWRDVMCPYGAVEAVKLAVENGEWRFLAPEDDFPITSVISLYGSENGNPVYDVHGRKVADHPGQFQMLGPGVYICNGKKVVR